VDIGVVVGVVVFVGGVDHFGHFEIGFVVFFVFVFVAIIRRRNHVGIIFWIFSRIVRISTLLYLNNNSYKQLQAVNSTFEIGLGGAVGSLYFG